MKYAALALLNDDEIRALRELLKQYALERLSWVTMRVDADIPTTEQQLTEMVQ